MIFSGIGIGLSRPTPALMGNSISLNCVGITQQVGQQRGSRWSDSRTNVVIFLHVVSRVSVRYDFQNTRGSGFATRSVS